MRKNLIKSGLVVLLASIACASSIMSAEIDTSKLEQQCKNITPQQRQMAKAAGYDIDSACDSLNGLTSEQTNDDGKVIPSVLPRDSFIETDERGVIENPNFESDSLNRANFNRDDFNRTRSENDYFNQEMEQLKPYGYELFAGVPTTFAPATDIPVPTDYVVGPGDEFQIQLLGKVNESHKLSVARDGVVNFPELGPIAVSGLKYSEAKELIQEKVLQQMIGVRAVISLGELRSIRVFVLGEAFKPGSYTVSSLSTMTNALFVSGGITEIGSLRNIQLKRQGEVVTVLDLYDLLLKGNTKDDVRLLPGDVIYIPPVGKTAGIQGEVKRPAIYELKNEKSLTGLIRLAGGYSANAFPNISQITRKSLSGFTTVIDLDLSDQKVKNTLIKNGDIIEISTVLDTFEDVVELKGAFHRERAIKWKAGLHLSDVIRSVKDFRESIDLNAGLIIRKKMPLRNVSVIYFNVSDLIKKKTNPSHFFDDIELMPLDEIITFEQNDKRLETLEPVLVKLNEQSAGGLTRLVDISGNVRYPGRYPLGEGMNVRELVLLAGGLSEASYLGNAEITRRDLTDKEVATVKHFNVNLAAQLSGIDSFTLEAKDKLAVYITPEYRENLTITLNGEVRFPGAYEFKRGETLSQVIKRAGGFTSMAHVEASIFTREDLKIQEAKQLQELRDQMQEDIAASQLEDAAAGESSALKDTEKLLDALTETEAIGRLIIQLAEVVSGKADDIQLKDGDQLIVPTFRQEVSVLGEVQHASSHLYNEHWTLDDYLEKSGGLSNRADEDRIYVVKADGSVFLPNRSGWLSHQNESLSPGDTVVVPLDSDRIKSIALWTNVTQIVYQLALGAAAINSL